MLLTQSRPESGEPQGSIYGHHDAFRTGTTWKLRYEEVRHNGAILVACTNDCVTDMARWISIFPLHGTGRLVVLTECIAEFSFKSREEGIRLAR